ncbi:hypothetical protein [Curtobacterium sp. MCBA15_004]|uniref:hypothetical protein n=1 Tax=Curtobacterium sp. MCBA15_004 TaxID=1898733 RepID=UPI0008DC9D0E|nr:hypothetical protein [Curtobacterium sp. MCBA15_004]WIA97613.1 hypothetical protein QOL16_04255 [Curtobacterium sp. MCBA15_004]
MFQRYTTALLPLGIAILGVLDAARASGAALLGWQTILQLVILIATTGAAFWLPLVPGRWAGRWKTGAAIVGAIASALIATIPDGRFTTATLILFLTAALKAVATEVGVQIRVDAAKTIDADSTAGPRVVANVFVSDPQKVSDGDPAIVGSEIAPTPAS